jgi:hypothetical protein
MLDHICRSAGCACMPERHSAMLLEAGQGHDQLCKLGSGCDQQMVESG